MSRIIITRPVAQPDYSVRLPMSKSIVNRMLVLDPEGTLQLLSGQEMLCDDLKVMAEAVRAISGRGNGTETVTIDLHASGTAMRFVTALCAVSKGTWILTGTDRLCRSPVGPLVNALRQAGATVDYLGNDGFPPLHISCTTQPVGGTVEIDCSESSQYVSALMLVADRFCKHLNIILKGVSSSAPYIKMTRHLIDGYGKGSVPVLEADWSAAAFWIEMKYLVSHLTDFNPDGIRLEGLNDESVQGDRTVIRIFSELECCKGMFEWDFRDNPDLVQPVAVSCCMTSVPFRFTGVRNLRLKETDRLDALRMELGKMGFVLDVGNDVCQFMGKRQESNQACQVGNPYLIETYNDHRMAMAFAGCALRFGQVAINQPEVVDKSYPGFWDVLREAGFGVTPLPPA